MPMHDWRRVAPGLYHDFHQDWTIQIRRTLNAGVLPKGYFALADQRVTGPEPDVVAVRMRGSEPRGGVVVADSPPHLKKAAQASSDAARYAAKANRIAIHHQLGHVVAMIEVVSPGNKSSQDALSAFVGKAVEFLRSGIHLLVIDPFPPGRRDPDGVGQAIWDSLVGEPLATGREERPCHIAAFDAGEVFTAYVDSVAYGESLPDAPLFLGPGWYVNVPLEETYRASWHVTPEPIRELVEGASPGGEGTPA